MIGTITNEELKKNIGKQVHLIRKLHPMQGDSIDVGGELKYSDKLGIPYLMSEEGTYAIFDEDIIGIPGEANEKPAYHRVTNPVK